LLWSAAASPGGSAFNDAGAHLLPAENDFVNDEISEHRIFFGRGAIKQHLSRHDRLIL